ncbi:MAG: hypothetical protein A2X13_14735 [Bacteroidetes bacterium GWC2_33_15]|nr:MAG: hypothetical protein A2X10_06800 [Bacteroidetes bacterium GWA2_33_15]OFX50129.1 MAG: hypothetical protein A2X13_14735 [Bacteroidetes bacterium GWC2_33_15]OFX65282.1 MAG: hypothetical protein A2X15_04310 [Bacteroidetes bacterium GWB2_32_14]OFX70508.1 MAG: hypothetical protein A2X14_04365 [Bacteroidetes bacterium GWD2_33_33]HAN19619.1 hypothetical protein [Bacteroidales bacterium]
MFNRFKNIISPILHPVVPGAALITPIAPTGLTLLVVSDTVIRLTWTDNSNNEAGFSIERSDDLGLTYTEIDTVAAGIETYDSESLTQETEYYYRVRAYKGSKYSAYCDAANATTYTFSFTNLTGFYTQSAEGEDLVDKLGGVSIPYVSGSGLDQLFDFSVLNDDRFDKGSYVGNAFGLPETYNFPYVGIYYDATSEMTRHYWKMTDFAYAVILSQSLLADNMFFLKALATTDTSNVIASWSELLIYSVAQTSTNLTKLKNYIGIQDTFYSANIATNGDFVTDSNSDGLADNWDGIKDTTNSSYAINIIQNGFTTKNQNTTKITVTGYVRIMRVTGNIYTIGKKYLLQYEYRSNGLFVANTYDGVNVYAKNCAINTANAIACELEFTATGIGGLYPVRFYGYGAVNNAPIGQYIEIGNVVLRIKYENYYAS